MKRALFRWFRQVSSAVLLLIALYGCAEVALRVYDSWTGQITRRHAYDRGLICKSWSVHHELKPLQRVSVPDPDTGEPIRLMTNSFGTRGPEIVVPKPPGVYRIICLGDDQTLGTQVPVADTFSMQLQKLLQSRSKIEIEVINAGNPDYCPLLCCLQFKHRLLGLQPDLVILNFDMSDVADDYRYRRNATMNDEQAPMSCVNPNLDAPRSQNPLARRNILLVPNWLELHGRRLWAKRILPRASPEIDSPLNQYLWLKDEAPDWTLYIRQALAPAAHLKEMSQGIYADFVVATYPAPWQVSATASDSESLRESAGVEQNVVYRSRRPFEILSRYFKEAQIPFCDASPDLQAISDGDRLYFKNSPCFTREGHALYAQVLANFILRQVRGVWQPETPPREERRPLAERRAPRR